MSRPTGNLRRGTAEEGDGRVIVSVQPCFPMRVKLVEEEWSGESNSTVWRWVLVNELDGAVCREGPGLWWSAGDAFAAASEALGFRFDLGALPGTKGDR